MMKVRDSRGGFTLVEIIFSVAILAITSLFVIQIFIKAVNLENRAGAYDNTLAETQAAIETFKIYRTLDPALLPDGTYKGAAYSESADGSFVFTLGFDKDFSPVDISAATDPASSAVYLITARGTPDNLKICRLELSAMRTTGFYLEPVEPQELFSLTAEVFAGSGVGT